MAGSPRSRIPFSSGVTLRSLGIVHDVVVSAAAITLSLALSWGVGIVLDTWQIWALVAGFTILSAVMFPIFSLNRGAWRYASLLDAVSIVKAVTTINVVFLIGCFLLFRGQYLPRSALVINWFVMIIALGGPRLAYRLMKERKFPDSRSIGEHGKREYILLYGFNDNADLYIRHARRVHSPDRVVGIVDAHRKNRRRHLQGVRVIGSLDDLPAFLERSVLAATPITQVIVTSTAISSRELADVVACVAPSKIAVKRLPDISRTTGTVEDNVAIEPLPVSIEDLLGRKEVKLDIREVARLLNDRCVAVTGAGGSIGAELVRQIAAFQPRRLILIDNNEFNLYTIDRQIAEAFPTVGVVSRVADVRQGNRIRALFAAHKPEIIFHAAALKHVPIVEENPIEGIETNLIGTRNVADAALACGAGAMVMVSTDKAVSPTSVMGATKRGAEAYCQGLDLSQTKTRFITVRFGNVMGSAGSVIPLFQSQLARGGPVTVTHRNITRYFMTIPEASRLILHAAGHGMSDRRAAGQIFVLDMGEPIRIAELAVRLIQLAGRRPHIDIPIVYTGLRKGEKLYEELFSAEETIEETGRPGLMVARSRVGDVQLLRRNIDSIAIAIANTDAVRAVDLLAHMVPEYNRTDRQAADAETVQRLVIASPDQTKEW